ncbi:MAG: hypothetical protein IJJ33_17925 [Victivallales bacterium]|nr:hypothetical protein [Victivallales bacterium]
MKERAYAFRRVLDEVHKPNRRNRSLARGDNETSVDESWCIVLPDDADPLVEYAAVDLQDYLRVSMNLNLPLRKTAKDRSIVLETVPVSGRSPRSFEFTVTENAVRIVGGNPSGTAQGVYFLEDWMNLREAPFLERGSQWHEPLFSPRMVHSGWGLDQFPDSHLNAIAHAGFDSILLFVKGPNQTTHGFMDFNNLIDRCEKFGLGVYFYSYLPSFKHPDEPDAEAFFDKSYGEVFRQSPKAKGLILVGESCCFPSKDERTTGRERPSNIGDKSRGCVVSTEREFSVTVDHRQSPCFFPCRDYPQWLNAVKKAVRKDAPDADIVFWTYNWGRESTEARLELIDALPQDVTLQATFEMFDTIEKYPNHRTVQPDYSITSPGPGFYFRSEAQAAKKRGLRLYSMTNTAGRTWDFGVVPYIPTPYQWFKRFRAMKAAHDDWGLSGIMDSHHYGWFPSEITECARWFFRSPEIDLEALLRKIAERDFGKDAAEEALDGWRLWSEAIDSYTPGFEDQAGPLRVGPAYPLIFYPILYPYSTQTLAYPTTPQSAAGARWIHPFYQPEQVPGMSHCGRRIVEDIQIMTHALDIWERGTAVMRKMLGKVPESKRRNAEKMIGVGEFCGHAIRTMVHVKRWWLLNKKLEIEYDSRTANALLDEMLALIEAETQNVTETIPLTEADSRLGWESSMDYVGGTWHLQWKLYLLDNLKEHAIPAYRKTVNGEERQ